MSISKELNANTKACLYIPCPTRMVHTKIGRKNNALCFLISVGYFDTITHADMKQYVMEGENTLDLHAYGPCDRVRIGRNIHYRQRVEFSDLLGLCEFCKQRGIKIALTDDFSVKIDNFVGCQTDLYILRKYARLHNQNVDTYLTNTCKVQFYTMLQSKHIRLEQEDDYLRILKGKDGYMDRAPFLLSKYNLAQEISAIFIPKMNLPKTMYHRSTPSLMLNYGYTDKLVEKDRKAGVLN